jgi:uncharacterized membrane protein
MALYESDYDESPSRGSGGMRMLAAAGLAAAATYAALRFGQRTEPRPPDHAPLRTRSDNRRGDLTVVGRTVTINRPRAEIYAFWRDFSNLEKFMENIEKVETNGAGRFRWHIRALLGQTVEVDTEIAQDIENELISWRSLPDSEIVAHGKVTFRDAPADRGTEVEAVVAYEAPGGELGRLIATIFRREPSVQGRHELKRLKMLLETGEIATSANRRQ